MRVRLKLESRPENVAVVRAALSGLAVAAELDAELTADLKTAVSEACNNVVLHAYGDATGRLLVDLEAARDGVRATVTDAGTGLRRISSNRDHMGLGLAVISALASRSEFLTADGGGTVVRMRFDREIAAGVGADPPGRGEGKAKGERRGRRVDGRGPEEPTVDLVGDIVVTVTPAELLGEVLGPVLRVMAASAGFSVSRVAELQDVNAAFSAYAEASAHVDARVALSSSTRRILLTGGPFAAGHPARHDAVTRRQADDVPDEHEALRALADELTTEPVDGGELLRLVLADAGRLGATARATCPRSQPR